MSETSFGKHTDEGNRRTGGHATAFGAADWLHLAAAPAFALMALLTAMPTGDMHLMTCMGMTGASPLNSMSFMYLLMSAFRAAPWVRLAARRKRAKPKPARNAAGESLT